MEHENELKEALDFVSPSALTYDEWLMVGMALKDSGLPVTVWGTVERPGRGPLPQGRVRQKVGELPRQHKACHREQHFSAGLFPRLERPGGPCAGLGRRALCRARCPGRGPRGRSPVGGSPRAGSARRVHPAEQIKRYLQALFEPEEYVAYVTESYRNGRRALCPQRLLLSADRRAAHHGAGSLRR